MDELTKRYSLDYLVMQTDRHERNGERKFISPKYVKKQCQIFLDIADGNDSKYIINEKRIAKIDKICKILVMAKGIKTGCKIYDALSGYQWLLIVASLCTVYRNNKKKRRYETVLLEICRKNGKTFIVAFLILLLFYLEPKFSRFFSVAPDGTLAKEIKQALEPLIKANIDVFEDGEFKILRDNITHKPTETVYTPLNTSKNCTVYLTSEPTEKGMKAIETILGEDAWNEAGNWVFNIKDKTYTRE